jgi:hypothetical protein
MFFYKKINMKRKNIILVMLLVLSGLFTMQSCTKEDNTPILTFSAAVPANPTPAVAAVIQMSGTSYDLKWEGKVTTTWDIHVGTTDKPGLTKAGLTTNAYTFTATEGGEYFWYVTTKDANGMVSTSPTWSFFLNNPPSVPKLKTPAANAVGFSVVGALTWSVTDPEGDPMTYDVYLGTTNTPGLVKSAVADSTYSPALLPTTTYFWKVVAKDSHGASSTSVVGTFTTGAKSLDPLSVFTGSYSADEPAETYKYDVTFALGTVASTVTTDNYWNSGWVAVFTIDLTKLTYSMPLTTWTSGYSGMESGIVDPKTGTMTGTYTIWVTKAGVTTISEQGVHTYTKK